jgi:hypothetical protein
MRLHELTREQWVARPSIERIFDYRREVVASLFGAPASTQTKRAEV